MRILKYTLELVDKQKIKLPSIRGEILSLQMQNGEIVFWVPASDKPDLMESVEFLIIGTGQRCPKNDCEYIGTVQHSNFVWHVFQNAAKQEGESSE